MAWLTVDSYLTEIYSFLGQEKTHSFRLARDWFKLRWREIGFNGLTIAVFLVQCRLNRHMKTLILSSYFHTPFFHFETFKPIRSIQTVVFCVSPPLGNSPLITLVLTTFFRRCLAKFRHWSEMALKQRHRGSRNGDKRHKDGLKLSEQLAINEVALASILANLICWRQNNREQKGDTTVRSCKLSKHF